MEISQISSPILVTGATGFIASHTIKLLLDSGYKVRGTVRSLANTSKNAFLYKLSPSNKDNLTLVEADLLDPESWLTATKDCEYVLHIASPFPAVAPKTEAEYLKPAVDGTLNVLNAALKNNCKRVIVTSSTAALMAGNEQDGKTYTEDDWGIPEKSSWYQRSKILAEKAAWEFYEKNKEKIEVLVVCPAFVFGPFYSSVKNGSEGFACDMMGGTFPGIMDLYFSPVDVRDVASGILKAMITKEAAGRRYNLCGDYITHENIVKILEKEFGPRGYIFPTKKMTEKEIKETGHPGAMKHVARMGKVFKLDNSRSKKELGMEYRDIEKTIVEMVESLIELGIIEKKNK